MEVIMKNQLSMDIEIAQKILSGSYSNLKKDTSYHNSSFMYKFTNEDIYMYKDHLKNKNKGLVVTASADQILNSILVGAKIIDSFDISRFPKYLYELKKAAVVSLSRDEYLDFFINNNCKNDFNDDVYFGINNHLEESSKKFWDSLFNFFDGYEIYYSPLFSRETIKKDIIISRNPYLEEDNYKKLQDNIKNVSIKHYVSDIKTIVKEVKDSYDLINLSSIFYYCFDSIDCYKELLSSAPLTTNGEAITYLYNVRKELIDGFNDKNYSIETFNNRKEGVLVYKK